MSEQHTAGSIFPVGYHRFHRSQVFNFQLNRFYSLGFARYEDMAEAGERIEDLDSWYQSMTRLADRAEKEERLLNAAIYCRGAEFFLKGDAPEKDALYDRFIELFDAALGEEAPERILVPFEGVRLPAVRLNPAGKNRRGTLLIHGGFDSLIEEFFFLMRYLADHGYEVIGFEGPGQGLVRRRYGLPWDYRWEKPTSAVLDHFELDEAAIYGISMGGYLCLRAAAYEKRITRVIASGHAVDYRRIMPLVFLPLTLFLLKQKSFLNRQASRKMAKDPMHDWQIGNAMYITKTESPAEAMETMFEMTRGQQHPERIEQDVLLLAGEKDHFIPLKMHALQVKALTAARSVTDRIFTTEEQAHNHCQIGNLPLALDVILEWLAQTSPAGHEETGSG